MEATIARYFAIKQQQKKLEEELEEVRRILLAVYPEPCVVEVGEYRLRISRQEKKEFNEENLLKVVEDPQIWRLISKVDVAKVNSLIKLGVIKEKTLEDTYTVKQTSYVQVSKK
ncbi:hypothetical protein P4V86_18400 [Brevibacillus laterosporus]|uniref:hypothetical protein n=1 Tax=Brevibacillus laterosporus TaxID=1465 RepID=UPI00036743C8|nr:hypothetical protein [Brevibacillus laterosporus]ATO51314.1 hypothetical protein BrL25_20770 [Brevibacillus laterosporus DSM 25]MBG9803101.1 hypothetical protein [Brevibacillus laterosporus]MED2005311.1 hypothetical protein [Brevibacillus laterosporus]MED4765005.1 hypothetical protein [Brevibacillus laterosporus]TPH12302.1 hypothetical protein EGH09_16500 [Brevibacillus laterosporus]